MKSKKDTTTVATKVLEVLFAIVAIILSVLVIVALIDYHFLGDTEYGDIQYAVVTDKFKSVRTHKSNDNKKKEEVKEYNIVFDGVSHKVTRSEYARYKVNDKIKYQKTTRTTRIFKWNIEGVEILKE